MLHDNVVTMWMYIEDSLNARSFSMCGLYLNLIFIWLRADNPFTDLFAYPWELIQIPPRVHYPSLLTTPVNDLHDTSAHNAFPYDTHWLTSWANFPRPFKTRWWSSSKVISPEQYRTGGFSHRNVTSMDEVKYLVWTHCLKESCSILITNLHFCASKPDTPQWSAHQAHNRSLQLPTSLTKSLSPLWSTWNHFTTETNWHNCKTA